MGLAVGEVKLLSYDQDWPKQFEIEKDNLRRIFGDSMPIEHVGSTSIEGISAKPIIDIAIGINKLEDFEQYRQIFEESPEYSIKEDSDKDEILIRKGPEENRTHFIHISEKSSPRFRNYIKFRDYMRNHPDARDEYESLKRALASKYADDRKSYTAAKADYINNIIKKASK